MDYPGKKEHIQQRRVVAPFALRGGCIEGNGDAQSKLEPHFGRL